jgi:uncharacterized protein YqfA (UPF0365 family)
MHLASFAIGFFVGVIFLVTVIVVLLLIRPWARSFFAGGRISLLEIIGMRFRGTPPDLLVDALITLKMRGHDVRMSVVETCYLANRSKIFEAKSLVALIEGELSGKS